MVSLRYFLAPWLWLKFASVEPSLFFTIMAHSMSDFGNVNMLLQKACRINGTSEPDLATPCDDKEKGIIFVANVNSYIQSTKTFLLFIIVALHASWSDRAGRKRKFFIMLAIVGLILNNACLLLHSYHWTLDPTYAALSSAILQCIFGHPSISMRAFGNMYLADVVEPRIRTMRFGIFSSVIMFATLVGNGIAGLLLSRVGFCKYYAACCFVSMIAATCGYLCIKEDSVTPQKTTIWSVFNLCHLVESFKIVFGKGSTKQKIIVTLLLSIFVLLLFADEGQYSTSYLYLKYRFNWNEVKYSIFLVYGCVGVIVGTLMSSILLSRVLKIQDTVIGIIGTSWDAAVALSYAFASKDWHLYLISSMDIFFGESLVVSVVYLTKFFDSSEIGHLFAVRQIFSALVPLGHPVYNFIFKTTLHTIPQSIFVVSFVLYITCSIIFSVIHFKLNKRENLSIGTVGT